MKRSDINPLPEYFDRYIELVADVELSTAFDDSLSQLNEFDAPRLVSLCDKTYAPNKWTVKDILQHVIDWERILSYRSLLFARSEGTIPQAVDGDLIAGTANARERTIDELIRELTVLRLATRSLYDSFDDETLRKQGTNWKAQISVLAMGFIILGHQIHHLKVIEEKYFPLLENQTLDRPMAIGTLT